MTEPRPGLRLAAALLACAASLACEARRAEPPPLPVEELSFQLVDGTEAAGIRFEHRHGGTGRRYMPETMGSGVAWLDYDGDGLVDLYLVNGAPTPGYEGPPPEDALYRNLGDGTFADVVARARAENPGYGMGATVGDVDNDGDEDLLLTNLGDDLLLRNNGDGTFSDATAEAGVGDPSWSTSAGFADIEGDGDLDLYVANYVDFTYQSHKVCGDVRMGFEAYCHPDVYGGVPDSLFVNQGGGRFAAAGAERLSKEAAAWKADGKGLGVTFLDVEGDGDEDIFVANDSTANFLWINRGDGVFEDEAVASGVAFDEDGATTAAMGVGVGDLDRDGDEDLFVTNLDYETNTLYANQGEGFFVGKTFEAGLGPPSWLLVGFGTEFLDLDDDGRLDLVVANGHVIDNVHLRREEVTYAQPSLVFRSEGEMRLRDVSELAGEAVTRPKVGRGLAAADFDLDGDLDLAVTQNNAPAVLLRNEQRDEGRWLEVRLIGTRSNRDGYGARVSVEAGGRRWVREHRSASSYLSRSEPVLHFGLGQVEGVERVEVTWPSGRREAWHHPPLDRRLTLREGGGPAR